MLKSPFSKTKILILAPVIMVMLFDGVFTLVGQPERYWQDYSLFNEGSPLGQVLMLHPLYFILFFIFYILFVMFLAANLKRPINIMVAVSFFLGHAWGGASWTPRIFYLLTGIHITGDWYPAIGYFVLISIVSGFFIDLWLRGEKQTS
jgi:hypothetical protein